jgi:hypothetical protein
MFRFLSTPYRTVSYVNRQGGADFMNLSAWGVCGGYGNELAHPQAL